MSLFAAWVVYPLVLLALCTGLGLLVDALSGRSLPGALIPPVGLAAIVVVGQFTTLSDPTADLTVPILVFLAVVGAVVSLPQRLARPGPWPTIAAVAVFCVFAAPVVLSGDPTFAGYVKLDDTATWLALTDRVMEHGRNLDGLEISTYQRTLEVNLGIGYPIGVFIPFGSAQKLVGGDLAWVFQPYMAFLAAMLTLALWEIAGGVLRRTSLRALAVFVAAQPALLFGYSLWGGVKEVATAAFVALAAALAPAVARDGARIRDVIPLAIAAGALIGVLGLGGLIWVAPMLAVLLGLAVRRFGTRRTLLSAVAFGLLAAVLALPILVGGVFSPLQSGLTKDTELGNLFGPLNPFEVLGIWPAGDFRLDPEVAVAGVALIVFGIAAALVGLWMAGRRRATALLLYASTLLACAAIVLVGSPWVDGKALSTASPAALLLAIVGAASVLKRDRLAGGVLVAVIAGGVLWSNALAYRDVSLAPYDQLVELQRIGEDFAGQGPTLMTEHNSFGARHFLRDLDGEGASELRARAIYLRDGGTPEDGETVDLDEINLEEVFVFRTLVLRRSPIGSRPPTPYRLVRSGKHYEVWQRPVEGAVIPEHLPLSEEVDPEEASSGGVDSAAVPKCSEVLGLGQTALAEGAPSVHLVAARHPAVFDGTSGYLFVPRTDRYVAWLGGSFGEQVELFVDDRLVGAARQRHNIEEGYTELGEVQLTEGEHSTKLDFNGADLHPGSGISLEGGQLLFTPATQQEDELVSVDIDQARQLCGRRWDWIEAVQP